MHRALVLLLAPLALAACAADPPQLRPARAVETPVLPPRGHLAERADHLTGPRVMSERTRGRELFMYGNAAARARLLVAGCVNGRRCAGTDVVRTAMVGCPPTDAEVWFLPTLQPAGADLDTAPTYAGADLDAMPTHAGADLDTAPTYAGADLDAMPTHARADLDIASTYAGADLDATPTHAGADLDTAPTHPGAAVWRQAVADLRPRFAIVFRTGPTSRVRATGPNVAAARRFARTAGLPFASGEPGGLAAWSTSVRPRTTSITVELPGERATARRAVRIAYALDRLSGTRFAAGALQERLGMIRHHQDPRM